MNKVKAQDQAQDKNNDSKFYTPENIESKEKEPLSLHHICSVENCTQQIFTLPDKTKTVTQKSDSKGTSIISYHPSTGIPKSKYCYYHTKVKESKLLQRSPIIESRLR